MTDKDANTLSLDGQVALVTGAASGIGAAVAECFAAAGAAVGVNDLRDTGPAEALVARIRAHGGRAIALAGDVSREADVQRVFDQLAAAFVRIDIVVANAGVQRDAAIAAMTLEQWRSVLDIDLTGQFLCLREGVRRFVQQGASAHSRAVGKLICMSSVHEVIPWAGHANYTASKGGIAMMMRSIAQEVAPRKIRVNAIAPGAIKTAINRAQWDDREAEQRLLKLIPYGRVGEPDDVARVALWLASDASDYVTGTTLFVDGGMCLYPAFADNG